jgi:hypothetical protein
MESALISTVRANVAELVDALDLGSSGETRESSSLSIRTKLRKGGGVNRQRRAKSVSLRIVRN